MAVFWLGGITVSSGRLCLSGDGVGGGLHDPDAAGKLWGKVSKLDMGMKLLIGARLVEGGQDGQDV